MVQCIDRIVHLFWQVHSINKLDLSAWWRIGAARPREALTLSFLVVYTWEKIQLDLILHTECLLTSTQSQEGEQLVVTLESCWLMKEDTGFACTTLFKSPPVLIPLVILYAPHDPSKGKITQVGLMGNCNHIYPLDASVCVPSTPWIRNKQRHLDP